METDTPAAIKMVRYAPQGTNSKVNGQGKQENTQKVENIDNAKIG